MQRPKLLDLAVYLIWVALALSAVSAAFATWRLSQSGGLDSQNPIALTLFAILIFAMFFLLILKLRAGSGWARALYIVLSVVSLMTALQNVSAQFRISAAEGVVKVAGYAVLYLAAGLLLTPQVHRWFAKGH